MTRTLVALVRDHPAVLNRTVSLIRRRGYHIDRLVVSRTDQPGMSRITVAIDGDNAHHVVEQLRRLIDVVAVGEVADEAADGWSGASAMWSACSMPATPQSYHWQADGADDHVED
jgi:acetolactate synthase small subunit